MTVRSVVLLLLFCFPILAQTDNLSGFMESALEHEITQLDQPLRVSAVNGVIRRKQGDQATLSNVLFEIRGPGTERTIRHALTDQKGQFKINGLKDGKYTVKATLNGFQSVVGTIELSRKNPHSQIKIEMPVGV
jgi:hypothetical protein